MTLYADGVGPWKFGDSPDEVEAGLIAMLGQPLEEDYIQGQFATNPPPIRQLSWDGFSVTFGTGASSNFPPEFNGYTYWGGGDVLASTPEGIRPGAGLSDLWEAYPAGELREDLMCVSGQAFVGYLQEGGEAYWFDLSDDLEFATTVAAGFQYFC